MISVWKGLGRRSHCKNQRTAASNPQPVAGHTMKALVSQQGKEIRQHLEGAHTLTFLWQSLGSLQMMA